METVDLKTAALCTLGKIFGYKPVVGRQLLEMVAGGDGAGDEDYGAAAERLFEMDREELGKLLGPYNGHSRLISGACLEETASELERLARDGWKYVCFGSRDYPELLSECGDAPLGFYFKSISGPREIFGVRPQISIVGTRDISSYGREWCSRIVHGMASAVRKPLVVSGMAIGVDIVAHTAALECGLPTVAVLPNGPDIIYPWRHIHHADRIASTAGCALVTDYPPGVKPIAINFLRRNRIIAGLSEATILIESKRKGGGMMTARLAGGYGRDVYALPGRVEDIRSQGCLQLIREKVAESIEDLDTLIPALGLGSNRVSGRDRLAEDVAAHFEGKVTAEEMKGLVEAALIVRKRRGIDIEGIASEMGIPYSDAACRVGLLESGGFISTDLLQTCSIRTKIF